MDTFWQFGYEIEARRDWDGAFPLRCAALRFVSLHLNEDIIIKKRNTRWMDGAALSAIPGVPTRILCLWIQGRALGGRRSFSGCV